MNPQPTAAKFLIVVEDEFYRELLTRQFRQYAGLEITVLSAVNRITQLQQYLPDFIVIDDRLSTADITECLNTIKFSFPTSLTAVVTADSESSTKLALMKLGAVEVIARDANTFDLLARWLETMLHVRYPSAGSLKRYSISEMPAVGAPAVSSSLPPFYEQERTLEDYTMEIIGQYLTRYNDNVVLVARKLGVGKSTIYRYLKDNKLQLSGKPTAKKKDIELESGTANTNYGQSVYDMDAGSTVLEKKAVAGLTDTQSITDLSKLYNLYKGNRTAVVEMIDVFLRENDRRVESLKRYQSSGDLYAVRKNLQEMKPAVECMGMQTLKGAIVQTKLLIDTNMDRNAINSGLSDIYSLYERCSDRLREQRREIL